MCRFFSLVMDRRGRLYYFNQQQRETLSIHQFDSHGLICEFHGLNEDLVNKYEYFPLATKKLTLDIENFKSEEYSHEYVGAWIEKHLIPDVFTNEEEIKLAAVKESGCVIKYIENPSPEVRLAAVKQNGWAIQYIKNPSLEIQVAAVKEDGYAIQYIENPSLEVQLAAVKEDSYAIEFIEDPAPEVLAYLESLEESED